MTLLLPSPTKQTAQLREREEREICALASMIADDYEAPDPDALSLLSNLSADAVNAFACMVLNNAIIHLSEHVIVCHECEEDARFNGSVRAAAEFVWSGNWMLCHGNMLCYSCQNYSGPVSDDDVRADERYEELYK